MPSGCFPRTSSNDREGIVFLLEKWWILTFKWWLPNFRTCDTEVNVWLNVVYAFEWSIDDFVCDVDIFALRMDFVIVIVHYALWLPFYMCKKNIYLFIFIVTSLMCWFFFFFWMISYSALSVSCHVHVHASKFVLEFIITDYVYFVEFFLWHTHIEYPIFNILKFPFLMFMHKLYELFESWLRSIFEKSTQGFNDYTINFDPFSHLNWI